MSEAETLWDVRPSREVRSEIVALETRLSDLLAKCERQESIWAEDEHL